MGVEYEVVSQMPKLKRRRADDNEFASMLLILIKGEVVALRVEDKAAVMRLGSRLRQAAKQQGLRIKQVYMPEDKKVYFQRVPDKAAS